MAFTLSPVKNGLMKCFRSIKYAKKKILTQPGTQNINLIDCICKMFPRGLHQRPDWPTHPGLSGTHLQNLRCQHSSFKVFLEKLMRIVPEDALRENHNPNPKPKPHRTSYKISKQPNIVLIDGVRTPFQQPGTTYAGVMPHFLAKATVEELLSRTKCPAYVLDCVTYETRLRSSRYIENIKGEEVNSSDEPREGFTEKGVFDLAHITMGYASNNSMTRAIEDIAAGQCGASVVGGVMLGIVNCTIDSTEMTAFSKTMTTSDIISLMKSSFNVDKLDFPAKINFLELFSKAQEEGQLVDLLAERFGVSRLEQDKLAYRSLQNAKKAQNLGLLSDVFTISVPEKGAVCKDNGICRNSTLEEMGKLEPAFVKPHGTVTTANSSVQTDGAAAMLLMTENKALVLGMKPKAYIRDYVYVPKVPKEQLLLSPTYAISKALERSGLAMSDIDVFEFHEASAAQILANMKTLDCDVFAQVHLGKKEKVGTLPMEKLNLWGGSLTFGHSFPATGFRLVNMAANRLLKGGFRYGLVAACDASEQGHAMIIEAYPQ